MKRRSVVFLVFSWLVPAFALASCTDDLSVGSDHIDGSGDGSASSDGAATDGSPSGDGGSNGDSASNVDGGSDRDGGPLEDGGCGVVIAQEGAVVPIQVMSDGQPNLAGGTLVPGTYVLTTYRVHGGGPTGTGNVRETLVLSGTNTSGAIARLNEVADTTGSFIAHGPLGEHATFSGDIHSMTIFVDEDCPMSDLGQIWHFAASGAALTLVEASTSTELVYTRVR